MLAGLSRLLSLTSLCGIAYGLYYSVETYGIIVCGSANKAVINLIFAVHNKIVNLLITVDKNNIMLLSVYKKYILE